MAALRVSNQAKEKKQKSPHQRAFISLRSRGSFAYPFMSPHRLVGVLLRLLTSCFCWCCPYTVQSWLVELAGVEPASEIPTSSVLHA